MGKAAVVGAGVLGRLLALRLQREGWSVTLYDRGDWTTRGACSFAAAGLVTPAMEASHGGDPAIFHLGMRSLHLWNQELSFYEAPRNLVRWGTLHLAYAQDVPLLDELCEKLTRRYPEAAPQMLIGDEIHAFEPNLGKSPFTKALLLPLDGHVKSHDLMKFLEQKIATLPITCQFDSNVTHLDSKQIATEQGNYESFDLVFDCRGISASQDLSTLRGVRGELIELHAPEVELQHALHLMHGRYPVYLVPRGRSCYALGATNIESENQGPVTVKSALELLSLAYGVHPGFRYAEIQKLVANCRPAFPNNRPKVSVQDGVWRLNGLYRYGFLMSPLLVELVIKLLHGQSLSHDERQMTEAPQQSSQGGNTYLWN